MQMTFSIDAQWLTEFIRHRFHGDGQPIDEIQTLVEELGIPQNNVADITQGVLEGRLKFKNKTESSLLVVEDDADLPKIADVLAKTQAELAEMRMALAMDADPVRFCDPWSMPLDDEFATYMVAHRGNPAKGDDAPYDADELRAMSAKQYLRTLIENRVGTDDATKGGTWTLDEPRLMAECGFESANSASRYRDAWHRLFKRTANRPELRERHIGYLSSAAASRGCVLEIDENDLAESTMRPANQKTIRPACEDVPEPDYAPSDKPRQWSGIVSPRGEFTPASFGMHETVCENVLKRLGKNRRQGEDAIEALMRYGWVICRTLPYYPYVRQPAEPTLVTEAQLKTLDQTKDLPDFAQ